MDAEEKEYNGADNDNILDKDSFEKDIKIKNRCSTKIGSSRQDSEDNLRC